MEEGREVKVSMKGREMTDISRGRLLCDCVEPKKKNPNYFEID